MEAGGIFPVFEPRPPMLTDSPDVHDLGKAMPDLWVVNPTRDLLDDFKASPNRQDGYCEYAVPPSLNAHNSKGVEVVFSYPLADVWTPNVLITSARTDSTRNLRA